MYKCYRLLNKAILSSSIKRMSSSASTGIERFETFQRWSEAVRHNGTVYLAGQLADAPEGSIERQTKEMLASVEKGLALAGSDKGRLLSCTIYLKSMTDYAAFNTIWDEWVPGGCAPARACVQASLANAGYLVEISVIAAAA